MRSFSSDVYPTVLRSDARGPRSTFVGTLLLLIALALSSGGCLVGLVAMDVSTKAENRKKQRTILKCREAGPVGHVVGTQLPEHDLPPQVFLRLCSRKGEALTSVPVDPDTFEALGRSIDYYWGRDQKSLVVQDVPLVHIDRQIYELVDLDVAPLIHDFALPERLRWAGRETVFLRAGDNILLRDSGVLRSEVDHPIGWLRTAVASHFEPLSKRHARDTDSVWYLDQRVEAVDAPTFEVLSVHFARDQQAVFYAAARIPGVDRDSFRVLSEHTAQDRQATYRIELSVAGWKLYCDDQLCHEHERRRTLPGQQIEWSDYDRFVF